MPPIKIGSKVRVTYAIGGGTMDGYLEWNTECGYFEGEKHHPLMLCVGYPYRGQPFWTECIYPGDKIEVLE